MTNKLFRFPNNKGRKRKLELNIDDLEAYNYFIENMKGDWNIDKSYQYINMNIYKGNYIGFQDSSHMQQYNLLIFMNLIKIFHFLMELLFIVVYLLYFFLSHSLFGPH